MSPLLVILGMAAVTYGPRLLGLWLAGTPLRGFWRRFLHFVPVSVFAALIVPALPSPTGDARETWVRLLAALVAAAVFWRLRRLWLGLLVGMGVFWLLRPG